MNELTSSMMAAMALHALSGALIFLALVAAVVWLVRFATKAELKKAFWTCLIFGAIGCILSCLWMGPMMMKAWDHDYDEQDYDDMEDRMEDMMDFEDDETQDSTETTETSETSETTETEGQ